MADPNVPQPIRPRELMENQENPKPEPSGFIPPAREHGEGVESWDYRVRLARKDWEVRHAREQGETDEHFQQRLKEQKELDRKVGESQEDYDRRISDHTQRKVIENIEKGLESSKRDLEDRKKTTTTTTTAKVNPVRTENKRS